MFSLAKYTYKKDFVILSSSIFSLILKREIKNYMYKITLVVKFQYIIQKIVEKLNAWFDNCI